MWHAPPLGFGVCVNRCAGKAVQERLGHGFLPQLLRENGESPPCEEDGLASIILTFVFIQEFRRMLGAFLQIDQAPDLFIIVIDIGALINFPSWRGSM